MTAAATGPDPATAPLTPAAIAATTGNAPGDFNRTNVDFRKPIPRPKAAPHAIDGHCHLFAARHAAAWFAAGDHYGFHSYVTQTPLEEALTLARDWPGRLHFVAIPQWAPLDAAMLDDWLRRLEAFHNIGSRIAKFHMAPGTMAMRQWSLNDRRIRRVMDEVVARGMALMTHVGDPDLWYATKYNAEPAKFGTRDEHYRQWEEAMSAYPGHPWLGAHMGGNPEDLPRLQRLLDRYPNLWLDCSATRWMVREVSARRERAREFFIRNQDRIFFGSDNVSGDERGFDFIASRLWCHRRLWETASIVPTPIRDPDLPEDQQPTIRGLALPDEVLQKLYYDNCVKFLGSVGGGF
jgi:hypothetical protein